MVLAPPAGAKVHVCLPSMLRLFGLMQKGDTRDAQGCVGWNLLQLLWQARVPQSAEQVLAGLLEIIVLNLDPDSHAPRWLTAPAWHQVHGCGPSSCAQLHEAEGVPTLQHAAIV